MTALSDTNAQGDAGAIAALFPINASALPAGLTSARPRVRDEGATFVTFRRSTR